MKNIKSLILLLLISTIYAQVSIPDIKKLGNDQLDAIKKELQSNNEIKTQNKVNQYELSILIYFSNLFPQKNCSRNLGTRFI